MGGGGPDSDSLIWAEIGIRIWVVGMILVMAVALLYVLYEFIRCCRIYKFQCTRLPQDPPSPILVEMAVQSPSLPPPSSAPEIPPRVYAQYPTGN